MEYSRSNTSDDLLPQRQLNGIHSIRGFGFCYKQQSIDAQHTQLIRRAFSFSFLFLWSDELLMPSKSNLSCHPSILALYPIPHHFLLSFFSPFLMSKVQQYLFSITIYVNCRVNKWCTNKWLQQRKWHHVLK